MEKQRNRGQDGAGLASVKLNAPPGKPYMERIRDNTSSPWTKLFRKLDKKLATLKSFVWFMLKYLPIQQIL